MKAQTCRRHVKTRAEEIFSKRQNFSRSRKTAFSRRRRRRLSRKAQRNHGGIQRRGDARVHERNREIASACVNGHRAAVQEKKKEMGLTANNNHAGGVEGLRNHPVVETQRPQRERSQTADHVVAKYLDC